MQASYDQIIGSLKKILSYSGSHSHNLLCLSELEKINFFLFCRLVEICGTSHMQTVLKNNKNAGFVKRRFQNCYIFS